jgi:ribosomal protein S18 acetylase RimI-like enzyme
VQDCLTVRPARPDELAEVGRLTLEAYLADGTVNPGGTYAMVLADASRRARYAALLVAVDAQDTVLGTITVCVPGSPLGQLARAGELEFRMLAVASGARRRGVGAALVTAVLKQAAQIGARRVLLSTEERMHAARRLYARLGFTRLPELDWYPVPGSKLLVYGVVTRAPGQ